MRYFSILLIAGLILGAGFQSGLSTASVKASTLSGEGPSLDAAGPLRLLTVNKMGAGTGSVMGAGITCGTDCSQYYSSGAVAYLTAKAAAGSRFAGWSGCSYSTTTKIGVSMVSNKTCTAKFNRVN